MNANPIVRPRVKPGNAGGDTRLGWGTSYNPRYKTRPRDPVMLAGMKDLFKAINVELTGGAAPEWVQLLPPGPLVQGRDGRWWTFGPEEQQTVFANFQLDEADLPIDREHATERKGPQGDEAPAAAWIVELADRNGDGGCWGRVDWTPRGRAQVEAREYRYLSPVFLYTKDLRIQALDSAGLTNKPNLRLAALNRQAETMEDDAMKKALCRLLGLPETATDQEIQDAVSKIKGDLATATNRAMPGELLVALGLEENAKPDQAAAKVAELAGQAKAQNTVLQTGTSLDLTKLVPRSDLDLALNRAETAEKALKERDAAELDGKIEIAVNTAIKGGKIAPSSKDYYLAMCRKDGGLDEFQTFAKAAPQIIQNPQLPDEPAKAAGALTDEQKAVCRNMGLDEAEYAKSLKEDA